MSVDFNFLSQNSKQYVQVTLQAVFTYAVVQLFKVTSKIYKIIILSQNGIDGNI